MIGYVDFLEYQVVNLKKKKKAIYDDVLRNKRPISERQTDRQTYAKEGGLVTDTK